MRLYKIFSSLSPRGSEFSGFYGGGADSAPPMENPFMGCFCQIFLNQAKLMYNFRSPAKGGSQNFKIEEVEEL